MRISQNTDLSREVLEIADKELPVIPLRGQVVFPGASVAFDVGREISVAATERAEKGDRYVFLVMQKRADKTSIEASDFYGVGTVSRIRQVSRLPGDRIRVYVEGVYRARALHYRDESGCFLALTEQIFPRRGDPVEEEAYLRTAKSLVREIVENDGKIPKETEAALSSAVTDADLYISICTHYLRLKEPAKQALLEETDLPSRLELFTGYLAEELEISKLERKIGGEVRKNVEKSQKEYYLREQLKVIHGELGDNEEEIGVLREKLLAKNLPEEAREKALGELARMDRMPSTSPEYTVVRNYLDWILDLPWNEKTQDCKDLKLVENILEEDHYGLEKIKERVLEYLAVFQLTGTLKAPILCLVGPPGVGKTSIARSIARATGRKFVRMSLGGLKDEAEIRGHRRTYIGAMPGRIIYELKNAKSSNPVFLLDEVDKISSDLRGDPSSALLEVLDPEQNSTFRDRYLEAEYDLSNVMFIATANTADTIPAPLLDRMEVIRLSGYTPQEKEEIAMRYLVPKQIKENGLTDERIEICDSAVREIVDGYTAEAGVRSLEREIGAVCRKAAVRVARGETKKINIRRGTVKSLLGARQYSRDKLVRDGSEVGAVTGLAWTSIGGTAMTIEAYVMQGKGEVLLTGMLGDVMKESARAAISYIRAHAAEFGIDGAEFEKKDIHIHVPEGATPKDGPSAGITLATAILSAFTGKPVRRDVAMTGEITLRGKVLPIGGLKEKALAADRIGIRTVVIPEDNVKNLEEIPESIRRRMRFVRVGEVNEVFSVAVEGFRE